MIVHKSIDISPFEVVYDFNPVTPLDLLPHSNPHEFVHKEKVSRTDFVKKLHEHVKSQIHKKKGDT